MNSNNVISFGKDPKKTEDKKDIDKDLLSLKSSYCDEMSNEIFGIVMRIIERSGHMDHVDTEDEGFFEDRIQHKGAVDAVVILEDSPCCTRK